MLTALVLHLVVAQADVAPLARTRTTRPMTLYTSPGGDDGRTCRQSSRPCRTPDGAFRKVPSRVDHPVRIIVGAGTYDGGMGTIADHDFGAAQLSAPGQIFVDCEQRSAVLGSGTATGTFTAVSAGSGATWATMTDGAQSWSAGAMSDGGSTGGAMGRGFWVHLTSGPGADGGVALPVVDNTATVLSVPGQWPTAPTTATTYALREPAAIIMGSTANVVTPGAETGTATRATFAAQMVVRGNRSGLDPALASGLPDGGSWAPVVVRGCMFYGDTAATQAGIATDGPVTLVESRVTNYGAASRFFIPTSAEAQIVALRNSIDVGGGRVVTFTRAGAVMPRLLFEQNEIVAAEYAVFGSFFDGYLWHSNMLGTFTQAVHRITTVTDGYSFGDRLKDAPVFFRTPGGGYTQLGGNGQMHVDGISVGNIRSGGSFANLAGAGGFQMTVNSGNGVYGAANSSVSIASGGRWVQIAGYGVDFRWRNSTTTITEAGGSATTPTAVNFTSHTTGFSIAQVNATVPHEFCDVRGSCAGWVEDTNPPWGFPVVRANVGAAYQWALEAVEVALGAGGTGSTNFAQAFTAAPFCSFNPIAASVAGDANVANSTTTTAVTVHSGPANGTVRGTCLGVR